MKIDLSKKIMSSDFSETNNTFFDALKEVVGVYDGQEGAMIFDILYEMKKAKDKESMVVELDKSQITFIKEKVLLSVKTNAFIRQQIIAYLDSNKK